LLALAVTLSRFFAVCLYRFGYSFQPVGFGASDSPPVRLRTRTHIITVTTVTTVTALSPLIYIYVL